MSNIVSSGRIRFEDLRSLGFAGIGAIYAGIGLPFANPVRILKVTNLTDVDLLISFNGISDHDVVATKGFFLYDYATNQSSSAGILEQAVGDRVYVKQITGAPTLGSVYVTVVYASQV
jgi:hypothetical protein